MSFVRFARQPQWLPKVVVCLFAAGGPVGCVFNDNGSVFTGSNVGRVIGFSGQSMNAGEQIKVQVLNPSTANPAVAANWTTIGTTNATNNPFDINGTNSYSWSINVTPVANAGQDVRWKAGGLARFRVLGGNGSPLVTFDETSCWIDAYNNGDTPLEIQAACESHAKPILTFVDKDPFPGSGLPYLGLRANSPAQADLQIGTSEAIVNMHKDRGALTTDLLSTLVLEATGTLMLRESAAPSGPVLWLNHDVVARQLNQLHA